MAKWGEGDPRWIVEERPDAVNPGNWHWSERDATAWSKKRLGELMENLAVEGAEGTATTADVKVTGEATANNRKAKLIFLYELVVDIKWKGKTPDGKAVNGSISIPNLSEENEIDEVDIDVSLKSDSSPANQAVRTLVKNKIAPLIREQLERWYTELQKEFTKGMVLPTKQAAAPTPAAPAPPKAAVNTGVKIHSQKAAPSGAGGTSTTTVTLKDTFACSPMDLFDALLNEEKVRAYTQSEAKIDSKLGGGFSLFNGNVTGTITDLVPSERIVMAWRFSSWTDGHYSTVTMKISAGDGKTFLDLVQTGVPTDDAERTQQGWRGQQFERIKGLFGYGAGGPAFF